MVSKYPSLRKLPIFTQRGGTRLKDFLRWFLRYFSGANLANKRLCLPYLKHTFRGAMLLLLYKVSGVRELVKLSRRMAIKTFHIDSIKDHIASLRREKIIDCKHYI